MADPKTPDFPSKLYEVYKRLCLKRKDVALNCQDWYREIYLKVVSK